MSCACKKCKPPVAPVSLMQAKTLALAANNDTPLCPPGYHWDEAQQKCIQDIIIPPPPPPDTWDCDPVLGCFKRNDGLGSFTSLADCQNNCVIGPPPICFPVPTVTIDPPNASVVLLPSYVAIHCSRNDAQIFYTLDGSTPTTASTLYTQPFQITTLPTAIKAVAIVNTCSYGPVTSAVYTSNTLFIFDFVCSDNDHAGAFNIFVADGHADLNWHLKLTLGGATNLKRIEIYETNSLGVWPPDGNVGNSQAWATDSPIYPDELGSTSFAVYPLVVFDDNQNPNVDYSYARQINSAYVTNFSTTYFAGPIAAGTYIWNLVGQPTLVGQPETNFFKIRIYLADGTLWQSIIQRVCVPVPTTNYCALWEMEEVAERYDTSPNKFHNLDEGNALQVAGKYGNCAQFQSASLHFLEGSFPTADPDYDCFILQPNDNFTFITWVNLQALTIPIFEFVTDGGEQGAWRLRTNGHTFVFEYQQDYGSLSSGVYIGQPQVFSLNYQVAVGNIPLNQWIMVACRYNIIAGTMRIKINNQYEDTLQRGVGLSNHVVRGGYSLLFGRTWLTTDRYGDIKIDRTFLIKEELSDADLTRIWNNSF